MKRFVEIIGLIALLATSARAQSASSDAVAEYVNAEMQRQHIPGLALLVSRDGNVIRAQGFGLANVEHQVPVKPETVFQSGSMGKQFTATAIMMLVEEGKLGLDDPITKYFPGAPATWEKITVRHLLTHTGGMTDYPSDFDFRRDHTENDLLERIKLVPLAFQPGE